MKARVLDGLLQRMAAVVISLHAASVAAQTPPPPPPPAGGELALMLLDMSGSMAERDPDGNVKFEIALRRANEFLDEVRANREYALWTFSGSAATPVVLFEGHATAEQVRAELVTIATRGVSGATPFAGSFCESIDYLISTQNARDLHTPPGTVPIIYDKRVVVLTDGLENNTRSTPPHECWGPRSMLDRPWTDMDTWQWKIFNKASTGRANTPPAPTAPATVIADVTMIFDSFIPSAPLSFAFIDTSFARKAPVDINAIAVEKKFIKQISPDLTRDFILAQTAIPASIGTVVVQQGLALKTEDALALLAYSGVSNRTGGEFLGVTSLSEIPRTGDANGDGCVDIQDYDAVIAKYGKNVGYDDAGDLNRDRTVNYNDYLTLLQNWGDGC